MLVPSIVALLASSAWSVIAAPALESANLNRGLRLIMSSPGDPGRWVTEEQKIRDYKSKRIGFVDITDITDTEVLAILSAPDDQDGASFLVNAVTYPTSVSHQTEANALIAKVSTTDPQSWLKTLTE
jgi:hypothetical protein